MLFPPGNVTRSKRRVTARRGTGKSVRTAQAWLRERTGWN
jgi:hypothetical protein